MRLLLALAALPIVAVGVAIGATNVLRPPPAVDRLAGVAVSIASVSVEPATAGRHRLRLSVNLSSTRDIDDCVAFALDEPFAGRRLTGPAGCVRPRGGTQVVALTLDTLTDDDVTFASHTIVWGVPGGRCGPLLEAFGVCVVDQAGTVAVERPHAAAGPAIGPFGSFGPLFSFAPLFSFGP